MYNVRIKKFFDTEQVQIFSNACHSEGEVERVRYNHITGEILTRPRHPAGSELMENPFANGRREWLVNLDNTQSLQDSAQKSASRTINSIYDIARSNPWDWFVTLTFSPDKVNRYNYEECTQKLSKWLNNLRRNSPDMVYLVVPERHKDGAYHFHGLFQNVDGLEFVDSGHVDGQGRIIYNIGNYKLGFTTATAIEDYHKACSYLCKYITKDLCALTSGKKRYWCSKNVRRPEVIEIMLEKSEGERIKEYIKDHTYVKKIDSPYNSVTYIERALSVE